MAKRPAEGQPDSLVFERLYAEWSGPVLRYIVHLTGPGAAADDLFQETWLHALKHWGQLRDPNKFGAWIYRIAWNLTLNHKRQFGRQTQVWIMSNLRGQVGEEFENWLEGVPDVAATPFEQSLLKERGEQVRRLLERLEPETQQMLQLRYFEQLTLAEVAEVMDVPLGTVCAKVHRALKGLQKVLRAEGISAADQL